MHLQCEEAVENRSRALAEKLAVVEVQQLVDRLEIVIDRLHRKLRRKQASMQVL